MNKYHFTALYAGLFFFVFFLVWFLDSQFIGLPVPSHWVGLFVSLMFICYVGYQHLNKKKFRPNKEHGSAKWGKKADARNYEDKDFKNNIILTNSEFMTMNGRPANRKYARNKNICVVGGSGSGKTFGYVKPNLMQCESEDFATSFVVTDPKDYNSYS